MEDEPEWELRQLLTEPVRELELVDVFIAQIPKKCASALINELNYVHPLPSLRHLRRISSKQSGQQYLNILLCHAHTTDDELTIPPTVQDFINKHELTPTLTQVPNGPAPTVTSWAEWREIWPMPWRVVDTTTCSVQYMEQLQRRAEKHMKRVKELVAGSAAKNAALIVDPLNNTSVKNASRVQPGSVLYRMLAAGINRSTAQFPQRHAVLEAIATAAARDVATWPERGAEPPEKRARTEDPAHITKQPYLCTGYVLYTLKEPCLMCAMAMVHSRFAIAVFEQSDADGGAFTVHGLHGRKGLNHHYTVYQLTEKSETTEKSEINDADAAQGTDKSDSDEAEQAPDVVYKTTVEAECSPPL